MTKDVDLFNASSITGLIARALHPLLLSYTCHSYSKSYSHHTMTSLASLAMQQLQAYGLPRDMVSKLFNSATLDIVALATRLAMIGLIAACLKSALTAVVHWIERGECNLSERSGETNHQRFSPPSMSELLLAGGSPLIWRRTRMFRLSCRTTGYQQ
jgi:hypothetical protein